MSFMEHEKQQTLPTVRRCEGKLRRNASGYGHECLKCKRCQYERWLEEGDQCTVHILPEVQVRYGEYVISYEPTNPGVTYGHVWHWVHDDYDGPGDHRYGIEKTLAAALDEIDQYEFENPE